MTAWDTEIDEGWYNLVKGMIRQTARIDLLAQLDIEAQKTTDYTTLRTTISDMLKYELETDAERR